MRWTNRVHDETVGIHMRHEAFPNELRVTLFKYDGQTVIWSQENEWNRAKQHGTRSPLNTCNVCNNGIPRYVPLFVVPGVIPPSINYTSYGKIWQRNSSWPLCTVCSFPSQCFDIATFGELIYGFLSSQTIKLVKVSEFYILAYLSYKENDDVLALSCAHCLD